MIPRPPLDRPSETPIADELDAELEARSGPFAFLERVHPRTGAHAYPVSLPETAPEPPAEVAAPRALEMTEEEARAGLGVPRVPRAPSTESLTIPREADRPAVPQSSRRRDRGGRAVEKESR